jgi:hypothetical protein
VQLFGHLRVLNGNKGIKLEHKETQDAYGQFQHEIQVATKTITIKVTQQIKIGNDPIGVNGLKT